MEAAKRELAGARTAALWSVTAMFRMQCDMKFNIAELELVPVSAVWEKVWVFCDFGQRGGVRLYEMKAC